MPLHAGYRTWTSSEGSEIKAELVSTDGSNVTLRLQNGKVSTISLSKLSPADQTFLKESPEEEKPQVAEDRKAKWLKRMDKAQEESKETGLPILVLFTGTTWCPYCIKLEKEVFSQKEFQSFANQNLVLLMLDFEPGGVPGNRRDEKLQEQFGVKGFPSYFITDSEGTKLSNGGYYEGITTSKFADWVRSAKPKS